MAHFSVNLGTAAALFTLISSACQTTSGPTAVPPPSTNTPLATPTLSPTPQSTNTPVPKPSTWQLRYVINRSGGPDGVRLTDFNGDGLMDLTTSFESSGDVYLFLHPGVQNLDKEWPFVIVGSVPRGEDAFGLDLDVDGAIDVISAHEGDTLGMYVHWGPRDPALMLNPDEWQTELIPTTQGKAWMYAISLDVNLDGNTDIVLGAKDDYYNNRNAIGDIGWLEAPTGDKRNLNNWVYHTMDHAGWPMSIIAHDVNGDGDPDILLTDRNSDEEHMGARWLENPGGNWEKEWTSHFFSGLKGSRPGFMSLGDLDDNGDAEYVFSLWQQDYIGLVNDESGQLFQIDINTDKPDIGGQKGAQVGDIDLNGSLDVVMTFEYGSFSVGWMNYQGSPFINNWSWNPIYEIPDGKFDQAILYDVDQDGDLDALTTEEVQGLGVIWFENPAIVLHN